MSYVKWSLVYS